MKFYKQLFLFIVFLSSFSLTNAQVEVIADGKLQTILEQHILFNELSQTQPGYRIRVGFFSGEGAKQKAFSLREKINNELPSLKVYVLFEEPNFIVKCGDYKTKLDAYGTYIKLKRNFNGVTIIKDYVFPTPIQEDKLPHR
ncbi:MAG: hypothetical protein LBM25_01845 [Bacteroidales bacterium]|jgi:hypothetical protein|nr:hypothetical protein [Bacteroidales bacterium]